MKNRRVVLSGCSGGGKSTLLEEMARRGYATVAEPGRRVIAAEQEHSGDGLPWINPESFCRKVFQTSFDDVNKAPDGLVLFDRSALDALIWCDRTGANLESSLRDKILSLGYDHCVYLFPPWPEIYVKDEQRRHDLSDALEEYEALCDRLPTLGFQTALVPKKPVADRAVWFEAQLNKGQTT